MRLVLVVGHRRSAKGLAKQLETASDYWLVASPVFDCGQALAMARQFHPSAVIVDIEMPNLSGVLAGTAIKLALPKTAPMLVALSRGDNYQAAVDAGVFDTILVRPIQIARLLEVLAAD